MDVCLVAVLSDGDSKTVCLMHTVCEHMLSHYEVVRLLIIPKGSAWRDTYDMDLLQPWADVLTTWD